MSIINDFRNETRGGNRPYQSSVLKGLQQIKDNGDEANLLLATLKSVLSEGKDFEAKLVVDSLGVTFLEVRSFDVDSGTLGTPLYYLPGSTTPETPTAPIKYINPETLLSQIVSNTTGIALESTLQSVATSANDIDNNTISIDNEIQAVNIKLTSAARTPNAIRTSASGNVNTVAATFYSVSVANVGIADGTILGGTALKSGEIINFDSGSLNNTFNSFAYDATGTEFIITFIS